MPLIFGRCHCFDGTFIRQVFPDFCLGWCAPSGALVKQRINRKPTSSLSLVPLPLANRSSHSELFAKNYTISNLSRMEFPLLRQKNFHANFEKGGNYENSLRQTMSWRAKPIVYEGAFECVLTMVTSRQWRTLICTSETEVVGSSSSRVNPSSIAHPWRTLLRVVGQREPRS